MKPADLFFSGQIIGQNGAEGHNGTTKIPTALVSTAFLIEWRIKFGGGQTQLISCPQ